MKRAAQLPPGIAGRAFTSAEAAAAGLRPGRLRRSDLDSPFRGIYAAPRTLVSAESLVLAYALRMSPDHFYSHVTAALIYGLPLPAHLQRSMTLHVSTETPAVRHGSTGVIGHHVKRGTVRVVDAYGLRVSSPVDTWCQLATVLSLDDLIRVGDALVRRKNPFATLAGLRAGAVRYAGKRGAKALRQALLWIRPGVDSPTETDVRLLLVRAGLPEPEVNGEITDGWGVCIAHGDLVYRDFRVLVEYDDGQHRTNESQYNSDVNGLDAIIEERWRVLRINKSYSSPVIVRRVETALRAAGWRPDQCAPPRESG
ncbi:hypothetical protein E3T55_00705 [Cryobacterium frigoriphilum]|uniref:DUF559 domain-containing protein n=1 Tax=Cryobacterium frigoriphilum TaxID=1259150 RepID=A0A4R9ABE0_9MICO|nr:hypothetical protein [Cryobacterium frigoriphilum]TFD55499.1 hypothetical protein E3T55_00705 [Cryobacterium frigoriphilum]